MPIIHIEGIKPPCKPYPVVPLVIRGKGDTARNNTRFMTSPSEITNFQNQLPIISIFTFVRNRRD